MRAKLLLLLLASLAVAPALFLAAEAPSARLLRVSLLEGDVTYQRPDLDRWVDLSINTPILEGDKIWVGRSGRAEVEFENGSFVRLSENTIIEFARLADINSRDGVEVRLVQGLASFEVQHAHIPPTGSLPHHVPLVDCKRTAVPDWNQANLC